MMVPTELPGARTAPSATVIGPKDPAPLKIAPEEIARGEVEDPLIDKFP
ncbi:MAG: hypothetical protein NTX49_08620 [Chlamydiae bacterium]|nr:hypothetical protein [Chlamydiota bacterium]